MDPRFERGVDLPLAAIRQGHVEIARELDHDHVIGVRIDVRQDQRIGALPGDGLAGRGIDIVRAEAVLLALGQPRARVRTDEQRGEGFALWLHV